MSSLTITTLQVDLKWENKDANMSLLKGLLSNSPKSDVFVLPEMFSTGFSMRPELFAEDMTGNTMTWLREQSQSLDAVLTGSFIAQENGLYYNRLVWMKPDGTFSLYDKRHLFSYGGEDKHYTRGTDRIVVEWRGWRICPLVCYDLRFPVWSRNDGSEDGIYYDLLIYVANWPVRRSHAWDALLIARAIENQSYVVGVNRVGKDGNGIYHSGGTAVIDYGGETIYRKKRQKAVNTVILEKDKLEDFRKRFGFLADQDVFFIKTNRM